MKPRYCFRVPLLAVCLCISCFIPNAWGAVPTASSSDKAGGQPSHGTTLAIPGPLRSFLRMAGISQKVLPEDVMPSLARNVFLLGYEGPPSRPRPTEFLILLMRYVQQARELQILAGPQSVIRVSNCDEAKPLLQVLGYRV